MFDKNSKLAMLYTSLKVLSFFIKELSMPLQYPIHLPIQPIMLEPNFGLTRLPLCPHHTSTLAPLDSHYGPTKLPLWPH